MVTCKRRALQSFNSLFLESVGNPLSMLEGKTGKGKGKAVVDSPLDCGVEKLKERRRCQAKSHLVFKIQRGKQMAHLGKSIESVSGFGSCPAAAETFVLLGCAFGGHSAVTPLPLPGHSWPSGPWRSLFPFFWLEPLALRWARNWADLFVILSPDLIVPDASH